ncbi:cation:proton antiporter domain-containing protein [Lawsonibacter sp.]|uniref:cation:proton antiporter domain-containing protein n=1 Tax=Lawsonibacter sp. TaxID=2185275 RepID=UPI00258B8FCD|nr:cation:proton antiporter [Lawsonibacter sp.]MCI6398587.1 cation:proton antiporter [Lawsonibacter sp.]MDY2975919.1 cation:proton antiporter [Oscillospiraceae bacterium]
MLTSIALLWLLGMALGAAARKLHLPALVGMLLAGILLGPFGADLLSPALLSVSADLRRLALILILLRAGLSLDLGSLRRSGRSAVLLCFLPAACEVLGMVLLAPRLLGVSVLDAAILGAVVGAVSPAVIVPRMLDLMEAGYGTEQGIPQMVLAGASVDDVFVVVLFSSFTGMASGGRFSPAALAGVPVSILLGAALGLGLGGLLARFFARFPLRDSAKAILLLALSILLTALEDRLGSRVPFSGLLAVLGTGLGLYRRQPAAAQRLAAKFGRLWVAAEILLFALVGAQLNLEYAAASGRTAVLLVLGALCFRALGVLLCMAGSPLNPKERLFAVLAYLPKATVQAAIGGVPLAMGLSCGQVVLTVAVIAILLTAPLGAFAIDVSYRRLLRRAG